MSLPLHSESYSCGDIIKHNGCSVIRGESGVSPPFPLIKKTMNYQKVWNTMNDLEMVTSKIVSAREILDSAIDRLAEHQYDKTETLLYAVDEFLQYYLAEFDTKFKDAWKETVMKVKQEEYDAPRYTDKEMDAMCDNAAKQDKVVKWRLPIEEVENDDTGETEYFITFPDDLLEAANLEVNDEVEWVDRNDGSFLLRKIEKTLTHDEMIAKGYTMTADGFWIKEKEESISHSSHYYAYDRNKTPRSMV